MKRFFCYEPNEISYPEGTYHSEVEAVDPEHAAEIFAEDAITYDGDYVDELAVDVVEEDGTLHELLVVVDYSPSLNVYDRD